MRLPFASPSQTNTTPAAVRELGRAGWRVPTGGATPSGATRCSALVPHNPRAMSRARKPESRWTCRRRSRGRRCPRHAFGSSGLCRASARRPPSFQDLLDCPGRKLRVGRRPYRLVGRVQGKTQTRKAASADERLATGQVPLTAVCCSYQSAQRLLPKSEPLSAVAQACQRKQNRPSYLLYESGVPGRLNPVPSCDRARGKGGDTIGRAGRRADGPRVRSYFWPPLRLTRMALEAGSVVVVSPAGVLSCNDRRAPCGKSDSTSESTSPTG